MADSLLHLRGESFGVGRGRNTLESSFKGKADNDSLRALRWVARRGYREIGVEGHFNAAPVIGHSRAPLVRGEVE